MFFEMQFLIYTVHLNILKTGVIQYIQYIYIVILQNIIFPKAKCYFKWFICLIFFPYVSSLIYLFIPFWLAVFLRSV